MAFTKEQKIGLYPNIDFLTKKPKQGMKSVGLTQENITLLQSLKAGDKIMLYENTYLKDSPKAPHMFVVIPTPKAETPEESF